MSHGARLFLSTALMLMFLAPTPTFATEPLDRMSGAGEDTREARILQRELSFLLAPIQSKEDLAAYLLHIENNAQSNSPLLRLTPDARKRFINSLVFTEKGLASYYYGDLVVQLSASEAYRT